MREMAANVRKMAEVDITRDKWMAELSDDFINIHPIYCNPLSNIYDIKVAIT
jgi:hypothetical protein